MGKLISIIMKIGLIWLCIVTVVSSLIIVFAYSVSLVPEFSLLNVLNKLELNPTGNKLIILRKLDEILLFTPAKDKISIILYNLSGFLIGISISSKPRSFLKSLVFISIILFIQNILGSFIGRHFKDIGYLTFLFSLAVIFIPRFLHKIYIPNFKIYQYKEVLGFVFKTKNGLIELQNPFRGIYIQGGAGSGKSASIFEPIIEQIAEQDFSGILYDFKSPELTEKARYCFRYSRVNFKTIDFKNPLNSHRVNPISPNYITKSPVAIEYAQTLVNNLIPGSIKKQDFWSSNAKMIVAGLIWYLREEEPDKCTLPHLISLLLHNDAPTVMKLLDSNPEASGMVVSLKQSFENQAQNQASGILSTIQNALSVLNTKEMFWLLSADEIDLRLNLPENPVFLALGNDSTLPSAYTPIISLIISVAVRQMNKPNQQKSILLLDEAPTIYIPNIEQIPATARSNKIATVFGVQDFSQLVDKYGEDKANVIVSNLGNQFYGRVTNVKSAQSITQLFSKEDKTFITNSTGQGTSGELIHMKSNKNRGKNESIQERDRVKVNQLINLNQGEFYGIIAEGKPREFLKTQFIANELSSLTIENEFSISETEIIKNYKRILEEAKSLV